MLGYEVDFGHEEIVSLVSCPKYSEKQVGYVAMSLLLRSGDQMLNLVINSVRNDLIGFRHDDAATALALTSIANVPGIELMSALHVEVQRVLVSPNTTPYVKKKAALCLLRLIRMIPNSIASADFAGHLATLLQDTHIGVLTSTLSLLIGLTGKHELEYSSLIPYVVHVLHTVAVKKQCSPDYLYYRTPSPWLQVKLLRFLQYYPDLMSSQEPYVPQLKQILNKILTDTDVSDSINKSNADHAVLFEAINLIVVFGDAGDVSLANACMRLLGKFVSVREPNIRYLGLMTMSRLAMLHDVNKDQIKQFQDTVVVSLKDADISVRRRALDLLFVMCDKDNVENIVTELITYLVAADAAIKEQMVLKIAVLAEKYAANMRWYVDTILQLISIAGDEVSPAIWHRVIVMVTNNPDGDLQTYVAETMFTVCSSKTAHEKAVAIGAYVLGEFGFLIAEQPGRSGEIQFDVIYQHWIRASVATKSIMLTTFAKFTNLYAETKGVVEPIFRRLLCSSNTELQQRACEYLAISTQLPAELTEDVLREMPRFREDKVSALEAVVSEEHKGGHDRNVYTKSKGEEAGQGGQGGQSANHPPPPPAASAPVADLLGGFDQEEEIAVPAFQESVGQVTQIGIAESLKAGIQSSFAKLCVAPQGVLFQNEHVQIGVKQEFRGSQGRVQLFIGNMGTEAWRDVRLVVAEGAHMRMQITDEESGVLQGTGSVGVKQQSKVQVMAEAMAPFSDATAVTLSFRTDSAEHKYPLTLPLVLTSFVEPVGGLTKESYMQRWGALAEKEAQEIVDANPAFNLDGLMTGLGFGRCEGVDNANTWTGGGTYRTGAATPDGASKISVGCLVRVEGNGQGKFRVTARTMHPLCSAALKSVVCAGISAGA